MVSFASNDYLGLSVHPDVMSAAHDAIDRWGTGATASRLVVGTRPCHAHLEEALASWLAVDAALVLPTGYAANLAVLTTFGAPDTTILSDAWNHASIIDGCRLSRARVEVFEHHDLDHLERLLARVGGRSVVVTDTVFSMDGDVADVVRLGELCARHGALLVLDEAHAVLGPAVPDELDAEILRVGTLSKSLGSLGGFVADPRALDDLVVNRARPFIFSTGLSPADVAAASAALAVVASDEGQQLRQRLRDHVHRLVPGHPSPIVPVIVGDERDAVDASTALLERGLLVPAIRPPTVPPGTSRLRITPSAAHDDADLDRLIEALERLALR